MAETTIKMWIKFSNGTIEATGYDTSGPPLFGGPINVGGTSSLIYPYRRLRNLSGLSARRVFWAEKGKEYYKNYRVRLITVGDLVLDVPSSSFPSPPGEQVEVYKGEVKLTSYHVGIVFQATVTVRFPSSPLPNENTPIRGTMIGEQESPISPFFPSQVRATFDSKFPIRYGEETASYEVNNYVLWGKLNI